MDRQLKIRPTRLSWRVIDGRVVVLDLERSEYFSVNSGGAAMWDLLVAGTTVQALVDLLTDRFEIDAVAAETDAAEFVAALEAKGLLAI